MAVATAMEAVAAARMILTQLRRGVVVVADKGSHRQRHRHRRSLRHCPDPSAHAVRRLHPDCSSPGRRSSNRRLEIASNASSHRRKSHWRRQKWTTERRESRSHLLTLNPHQRRRQRRRQRQQQRRCALYLVTRLPETRANRVAAATRRAIIIRGRRQTTRTCPYRTHRTRRRTIPTTVRATKKTQGLADGDNPRHASSRSRCNSVQVQEKQRAKKQARRSLPRPFAIAM